MNTSGHILSIKKVSAISDLSSFISRIDTISILLDRSIEWTSERSYALVFLRLIANIHRCSLLRFRMQASAALESSVLAKSHHVVTPRLIPRHHERARWRPIYPTRYFTIMFNNSQTLTSEGKPLSTFHPRFSLSYLFTNLISSLRGWLNGIVAISFACKVFWCHVEVTSGMRPEVRGLAFLRDLFVDA